jgi:NAD(P)H-quinone oxidoreductase subunit 5
VSIAALTAVAVLAPLVLLALLGVPAFARRRLGEATTGFLVQLAFAVSFLLLLLAAVLLGASGRGREVVDLGTWFAIPGHHFELRLLLDGLSLPFALFTVALCAVVAVFANRYLHREPGYGRFFVLLSLFAAGMLFVVLAGTIEVLFAGWELVGLSSALLVAFFQDRPLPAENGLRVFVVYRACDVGILLAAVVIHHAYGTGDFTRLFGAAAWPGGTVTLDAGRATLVAFLLVFAAMGKFAQIPFSGWLPRAMEGPTPSSAIFYGALSVHAGAYVLLRFAPLLERAPAASVAIVVLGLATSLHSALVGRVQSDIKSALAYASLTQVGLILVEIGLGLNVLAVIHVVGHACLRSLQFLRAPSLLHDLHGVEAAVGSHLVHLALKPEQRLRSARRDRLYRFALERAHLDRFLERAVVAPFVAVFSALDRLERRLTGNRDA